MLPRTEHVNSAQGENNGQPDRAERGERDRAIRTAARRRWPTAISAEAAASLAAELRKQVRGEVRFDAGSRALYATDGSSYRQVPIGVVVPHDADDVIATVATARHFGAPVLGRGCGTSLACQCCNVAVVMDFSKYMHRLLAIDAARRLGTVQPGCVLDDLTPPKRLNVRLGRLTSGSTTRCARCFRRHAK